MRDLFQDLKQLIEDLVESHSEKKRRGYAKEAEKKLKKIEQRQAMLEHQVEMEKGVRDDLFGKLPGAKDDE